MLNQSLQRFGDIVWGDIMGHFIGKSLVVGLGALFLLLSNTAKAEDSVTLYRVVRSGNQILVTYRKNFNTCVHMVNLQRQILHVQNHFCDSNVNTTTVPVSAFTSSMEIGKLVMLCHGNNYNVCSSGVAVSGSASPLVYLPPQPPQPVTPSELPLYNYRPVPTPYNPAYFATLGGNGNPFAGMGAPQGYLALEGLASIWPMLVANYPYLAYELQRRNFVLASVAAVTAAPICPGMFSEYDPASTAVKRSACQALHVNWVESLSASSAQQCYSHCLQVAAQ